MVGSLLVTIPQATKQVLVESAKEESYCKEKGFEVPAWKKPYSCNSWQESGGLLFKKSLWHMFP